MKHSTLLIAAALVASISFADDAEYKIITTATLKDGSLIKADFLSTEIKGSTAFLTELALKPEIVDSLNFKGTNGEARAKLVNADNFAITITDESYKLNSSLGSLNVPVKNIRSLTFKKVSSALESNDGLIFYCTFDDADAVQNPAIGPSARYNKATFSEGKQGQALFAQRYKPQVSYNLPANFFGNSGCIEFWAKIMKTSPHIGTGGDPRLFTLTEAISGDTFCGIDIVSNNGDANCGFSAGTIVGNIVSIGGMRNLTYYDLFKESDYREWHHYALIWDADGINGLPNGESRKAALFVDGKLIPCAKFNSRCTTDIKNLVAKPSLLSFTHDPERDSEHQTKSPFLIDEFKIWNYAKTDFDLAN